MVNLIVDQFEELMARANEYHKKAQWQEKLRTLQNALDICDQPDLPEAEQRTQQVLLEMGGVRRRFGQYDQGIDTLQRALKAFVHASPIMRAKVLGELGVMYRLSNEFGRAQEMFNEQYKLAWESATEAEAELCRAIGNEGMSAYNLSQEKQPQDEELLKFAFNRLWERVNRARNLYTRLLKERPESKYVDLSKAWETIGIDRLTLCYIATRETGEAVRLAEESQRKQTANDPTVIAFSRFFYGNALWSDGQRDKALEQWSAPNGVCASAMALCKEPSAEHNKYLKLLAYAGVDFYSYDEQGFSALDYAVLSDNQDAKEMIEVILGAFRKALRQKFEGYQPKLTDNEIEGKSEKEITMRLRQAQLRRHYRAILQEHLRPEMRSEDHDSIVKMRRTYAELLKSDPSMRSVFDAFYYVKYTDFKTHGRLPRSFDGLTKEFASAADDSAGTDDDQFIIFLSYRWIGKTNHPPREGPDDDNNTQFKRILRAVEEFLTLHRDVKAERLSLWLDYACIDQSRTERRERGINALPFAVLQCDAMISLVDEPYYERAWCAVEVVLMCELQAAYSLHDWWEHILHSPKSDRLNGTLRKGTVGRKLEVNKLRLSDEELDRPKIDFLVRQSKLLGKDDA